MRRGGWDNDWHGIGIIEQREAVDREGNMPRALHKGGKTYKQNKNQIPLSPKHVLHLPAIIYNLVFNYLIKSRDLEQIVPSGFD